MIVQMYTGEGRITAHMFADGEETVLDMSRGNARSFVFFLLATLHPRMGRLLQLVVGWPRS